MIYVRRSYKQTDTENPITILCPHVFCVPIHHKWKVLKWNSNRKIECIFATTDKNFLYSKIEFDSLEQSFEVIISFKV